MPDSPYLSIFELARGGTVETIHYGSVAIVNSQGELVAWYGNPETITYLRSSAKPFQALPFIESGGQEAYNLSLKEVAIICASHSGTDEHVATVKAIQAKAGIQEEDLLCGIHPPSHRPTVAAMSQRNEVPTENRHNCSGKHTGMIAYARKQNLPYRLSDHPYIDPNHPVQKDIIRAFAEMCGLATQQINIGIDGCSAPNFAVPLRNAAWAYARLCDPSGLPEKRSLACQTISTAMITYPNMIGGPDSFDTRLMQAVRLKVLCKGGAEGFQALGIMPGAIFPGSPALGIAFKISDGDLQGHNLAAGDKRGFIRPAVTLEILRQLDVITPDELESLSEYGPSFELTNFRKLIVGNAYPCFTLNRKE